jgi:DNA (cytosine-5)-methyltransferase 1
MARNDRQLTALHLFAGAGGGILADLLTGHRIVGAVEWEEYPCRVLDARQADGSLSPFPVWHGDIREFNKRIAPAYAGRVDIVAGGFPCQPFSVAGKRAGDDDERNMWPATAECLRIVKPRWFLGENVSGLLSVDAGRYFGTILRDLASLGYGHIRYGVLSAADVGAPHKRDRLWIRATLGDTERKRREG